MSCARTIFLAMSFVASTSFGLQATEVPFQSSETVVYIPRTAPGMETADILMPDRELGYLKRLDAGSDDLRFLDLFQAPTTNKIAVDSDLCRQAAESVAGSFDGWTVSPPALMKTRYGQVCDLTLTDPNPQGDLRERHIISTFLHGKLFVFQARFRKTPSKAQIDELREFTQKLYVVPHEAKTKTSGPKSNRAPASL